MIYFFLSAAFMAAGFLTALCGLGAFAFLGVFAFFSFLATLGFLAAFLGVFLAACFLIFFSFLAVGFQFSYFFTYVITLLNSKCSSF